MENRIYWIWKDAARGKAQDNYITVSGTEFYHIMNDKTQERYFIRIKGETPAETLCMETTQEEYEQWKLEKDRELYRAKRWCGATICSLDAPMRIAGSTECVTLADQIVDVPGMEEREEALQFEKFIAELLVKWDEQDRFIAQNRFLTEDPMTIYEIARQLHYSYEPARRRVVRVRARLIRAMRRYDPELTAFYENGAGSCQR